MVSSSPTAGSFDIAHPSAPAVSGAERLRGQRVAVVVFSHYPSDPRPRRAAETMAQLGMEVDVISLQQNADDARRETFNGVNILRMPVKHLRGGKLAYLFQYGAFIFVAFLLLAWRTLTRRYNLVHVHNMPDVLVFAALVPKLFGAKVILDLHDPMPELMMTIYGLERESRAVRLMKHLERWSIRFANVVFTVSTTFEKLFAARSCPAAKLRVVMNTPDEGIFSYRAAAPEVPGERDATRPFVIMCHGALVERHGADLAVEALAIIRPAIPNAQLRIYGRRTAYVDRVMQKVQERGLQDAVQYLGGKKLEEIAQAIDECDLGIVPNRRSVFTEINTPTRIFEYLARAKPVVAPRSAGIEDYFGEDELVYFDLGDAADLARKMQYVFAQPRAVNEILHRGQKKYLRHRWTAERARLAGMVADLLPGRGRSPSPPQPLPPVTPIQEHAHE